MSNTPPLLRVRDLSVRFGNAPRAADNVSFDAHAGRTLAIVGESGSGKSVTAMSLLKLLPSPPATIESGTAHFQSSRGELDLLSRSQRELRSIRGSEIAMIFQEPMTCLNPVLTIGEQITETIELHQRLKPAHARDAAINALRDVGMNNPAERLNDYPHQFSGGMRQRVMIAIALACKPRLLIADEPTTALDVTIQSEVLALLRSLQATRNLGIILITHAFGVVAENADDVAVMYAGTIVESATVHDLFNNPLHPYTRGLLTSIPSMHSRRDRLTTIDQITGDPRQHQPIHGKRPWWPTTSTGSSTMLQLNQHAVRVWDS